MLSEDEKIVNKARQRDCLLDYVSYPDIAIWKRAVLFAIGNVISLSIVAIIVELILKLSNHPDSGNAGNFICYAILFVALMAVVITDIPKIGKLTKPLHLNLYSIPITRFTAVSDASAPTGPSRRKPTTTLTKNAIRSSFIYHAARRLSCG